jgi:Rrf2 family transcriptional regulator, nitric oxide-sensitive transcriptional repressor
MQLTRFSDLSMRLLMYLASRDHPMDAMVTARAVSTLFDVPYTHMVKVVHQLGQHGLITTTKGKGGGLRLSRSPKSIRIGEVLRMTEPGNSVIDCFTQPCPLRSNCLLKHALDGAYDAFFIKMDEFTLADVVNMPTRKLLLQLSA